jgi:murein DD-endopeptidase MepM/ murein hydrolase activator NlpD
MDPNQDLPYRENSSKTLAILIIILLLIIGVVFVLVIFFKPKTQPFDTRTGEIRSTPKEQIEALDPSIRKVYNLTDEARLFDELFDELVYAETPDVNLIGEFVGSFRDYAAKYSAGTKILPGSQPVLPAYDSALISFDLQQKYLNASITTLIGSIAKKKKVFMTIPVTYPMEKENARIVSGFGMRDHPILNERKMHTGIDIAAPVGTAVVATASGRVVKTEEKPGYGRNCIVEHKFGYQTLYGHMVRIVVGENNFLQKGDVVGYVGNTGLSVAPHLHYEVRKNGKVMNPSFFIFEGLTKEEYKEVIHLGSKTNDILSF